MRHQDTYWTADVAPRRTKYDAATSALLAKMFIFERNSGQADAVLEHVERGTSRYDHGGVGDCCLVTCWGAPSIAAAAVSWCGARTADFGSQSGSGEVLPTLTAPIDPWPTPTTSVAGIVYSPTLWPCSTLCRLAHHVPLLVVLLSPVQLRRRAVCSSTNRTTFRFAP